MLLITIDLIGTMEFEWFPEGCRLMMRNLVTCVLLLVIAHGDLWAQSRIIDTHIHLYDPTRPGGIPWPRPGSELYRPYLPPDFAAVAGPAGVTAAVVVEASPLTEDNQWMLDLMADEPLLVALVGRLYLGSDDFADNLARYATNPRFVGIRHRVRETDLDDESIMASLHSMVECNIALDMMIRGMTLADASVVAAAFPDLRIIINHVAGRPIDGTGPDSTWVQEIEDLARHPNVYMKISGLYQNTRLEPAVTDVSYYAPALDVVWNAFGEDRLIYGSNWPVSTMYGKYGPNVDIARSYLASKGEVALDKVMWRNAVKAYDLELED